MKNKKIGAVCFYGEKPGEEIAFETILLDETVIQGDVWVLKEAMQQVGGFNYRLDEKRNYELLVRIAKEYMVVREEGEGYLSSDDWINLREESDIKEVSKGWKTDCYLISRYKEELRSLGFFDEAVLGIFSTGGEPAVKYLEKMLGEEEEYWDIYNCTQPILIYIGSSVCGGVLDVFSRSLGDALKELGQNIEYYDFSVKKIEELENYTKRRFKALIGIHTYMFSMPRENGGLVHDEINAPKYNFLFDHPISAGALTELVPKKLCFLMPDGNYVKFIKMRMGYNARFFPPAGEIRFSGKRERDYEIIFLGSLGSSPKELAEKLWKIRLQDRKRGHLLNRFVLYMRKNLNKTPEEVFQNVLDDDEEDYFEEEFMRIFRRESWVIYDFSRCIRNKVVSFLLDTGLTLHVYGDSWKRSELAGHPQLICHDEVKAEEALEEYARSKISLNIMSWHKDGFTERIANAMLQKSVVVTDRSTYLEQNFVNGEELLMFDLENLKELPEKIRHLLYNEKRREQMVEKAYAKVISCHTWQQRAEKLLEFIEEDRRSG